MRALVVTAFVLLTGCDPNPKGGQVPPARDACNKVVGDWTITRCQHLVVDGGQAFETPGGTVMKIARKGDEMLVGSGDDPARVVPTQHDENKCAGTGLVMVLTSPNALEIDRFDADFKSHCSLTR